MPELYLNKGKGELEWFEACVMPCEKNHFLSMVVGHKVISASTLATPGVEGVKSCYFPVWQKGIFSGKVFSKVERGFFNLIIIKKKKKPKENFSISQDFL